jgi:hypothetical protein
MLLSRPLRRVLSSACFAISSVWAAAGVLKLIFGVRITFPIFPPIDLDRVAAVPAIGVALGLAVVGALVGRASLPSPEREPQGIGAVDPQLLPLSAIPTSSPAEVRPPTPVSTRRPSA